MLGGKGRFLDHEARSLPGKTNRDVEKDRGGGECVGRLKIFFLSWPKDQKDHLGIKGRVAEHIRDKINRCQAL